MSTTTGTPRKVRFLRPPSVADYERMTQHLRRLVAEEVADQIRAVEERRAANRPMTRRRRADEWTADEVMACADLWARIYTDRWAEPAAVKARRLDELAAATDPRRKQEAS